MITLISPLKHPTSPHALHMGVGSLEETTLIRIEMFHYRIKVTSQKNFAFIYFHLMAQVNPIMSAKCVTKGHIRAFDLQLQTTVP